MAKEKRWSIAYGVDAFQYPDNLDKTIPGYMPFAGHVERFQSLELFHVKITDSNEPD